MVTLLAALIGGGLAIAGGLAGSFATDRRERNRWRRDAQLRAGTELLSSLQEVIRRMIHLAYLTEKPPQPTLTPAASSYHEASVNWNSSIYAALLVSSPKIADMVQGLDREVDRLLERALEKSWSRAEFREERRSLGRLAATYLNASRGEVGWSPIPIETVWAWDEAAADLLLRRSFHGRRLTAAFLVTAGSVVVWIPLDVRDSRLVLARDWHGVQSAARTGAESAPGTGLFRCTPTRRSR